MKVIDLLNKIAKGEGVPKKIKCDGVIYNYEFQNTIIGAYDYRSQNGNCLMSNIAGHLYLTDILNNEVEIIEEDTFEDIVEIDKMCMLSEGNFENIDAWQKANNKIYEDKIDKLIRNQKKIISKLEDN